MKRALVLAVMLACGGRTDMGGEVDAGAVETSAPSIPCTTGTIDTGTTSDSTTTVIAGDVDEHVYWAKHRKLWTQGADGVSSVLADFSPEYIFGIVVRKDDLLVDTYTTIYSVPKAGGTPTVFASGFTAVEIWPYRNGLVVFDALHIARIDGDGTQHAIAEASNPSIAADGDELFIGDVDKIVRMNPLTQTVTTIATGLQNGCSNLRVDGTRLLFVALTSDLTPGDLMVVDKNGGTPTTLYKGANYEHVIDMAIDETGIYAAVGEGGYMFHGGLMRLDEYGASTTLVPQSEQFVPWFVALTPHSVVWVQDSDVEGLFPFVLRMCK